MLDLSERKRFNNNGYIAYYIPEHHLANNAGFVYEHMIMAEEMLGRELKRGEVVHHKDFNRRNNSVDNLMVFKTGSDHAAFHRGRDIFLDEDVYVAIGMHNQNICPLCGNVKDNKADMCRKCYDVKRTSNVPPKETLYDLLRKYNMCEIGRMFGVSDNAVRKWCKKYGLPHRREDLKALKCANIS